MPLEMAPSLCHARMQAFPYFYVPYGVDFPQEEEAGARSLSPCVMVQRDVDGTGTNTVLCILSSDFLPRQAIQTSSGVQRPSSCAAWPRRWTTG